MKGTPAVNIKLHLAFTVKVITEWKSVKFQTPQNKDEISFTKRNCVATAGGGSQSELLLSRPCFRCKSRHQTSLSDRHSINGLTHGTVLTACNPGSEDQSLPVIIPPKIQEINLWAYFDTDFWKNFTSREAVQKLNLKPPSHESRQIVTINGVQKQSWPIFEDLIVWMIKRESKQKSLGVRQISQRRIAQFEVLEKTQK